MSSLSQRRPRRPCWRNRTARALMVSAGSMASGRLTPTRRRREAVRTVLADAAQKTNDLDDEARLKTAARLDAVLKVVRSFPALTVEAEEA